VYVNSVMSVLRLHVFVVYEEYNLHFGFNICVVCFVIEDRLFLFLVWYRNRLGCMCDTNFCRTVFLFLNMRNIRFVFNET
jgi:hypothetical protein